MNTTYLRKLPKNLGLIVTILLLHAIVPSPVHGQSGAPDRQIYLPIVMRSIPPGNFTIKDLGQYGGASQTVTVAGNRAYVGVGSRLAIIDISDPANPQLLGQSPILADTIRSIDVRNNLAYVAAGLGGGLLVLDVSNPANPIQITGYKATSGVAEKVTVVNNRAYIAYANGGMHIVDISDPLHPKLLGTYNTQSLVEGVCVFGNLAYIAAYYDGVHIVDVSNPSLPKLIGTYSTIAAAQIQVINKTIYVADAMSGLYILDASNPASVSLVSKYSVRWPNDYEYDYDLQVVGSRVYLAGQKDGLQVLDISNPKLPKLLGAFPSLTTSARVLNNLAFIADLNAGLVIVNISDPAHIQSTGVYQTAPVYGAVVSNHRLYLATGLGIEILDDIYPATFSRLGFYLTPGPVHDLTVSGNVLYLTYTSPNMGGMLLILSLSNPDNPQLVGSFNLPCALPTEVIVQDQLAYISGDSGFIILDVSNIAAPRLVGHSSEFGYRFQIVGKIGYLAGMSEGLKILDLSDPTNPTKIASLASPSYAVDLSIENGIAYVSDYFNGVQIIDIHTPNDPKLLLSYQLPCPAVANEGIYSAGGLIYLYGEGSFYVIDASNPLTPNIRASYPLAGAYGNPGMIRKISLVGDRVYLSGKAEGLQVLQVVLP